MYPLLSRLRRSPGYSSCERFQYLAASEYYHSVQDLILYDTSLEKNWGQELVLLYIFSRQSSLVLLRTLEAGFPFV